MERIRISGILPYDGEYDIDGSYFTNRELHRIKQIAGVRAGEIDEAFAAGDTDIIVAVAVIALERSGRQVDVDRLWDAEFGRITLLADPTAERQPDPTTSAASGKSAGGGRSSGAGSSTCSADLASGQNRTGSPPSGTSAASGPATSAT